MRRGRARQQPALGPDKSDGLLGNHSLTHSVELGTTRDPAVVAREIGGNEELLGDLNDRRLFRPYMGGGLLTRRVLSPEAVQHLCEGGYTLVLFSCVPRDWENPEGWPEVALEEIGQRDWTLLVVHDVERYGSMKQLGRFLDEVRRRGIELVQEFPPDCVPIRDGKIVGCLDGLVCGEEPETPMKLSTAAAELVD